MRRRMRSSSGSRLSKKWPTTGPATTRSGVIGSDSDSGRALGEASYALS
ncbi:hypothetical protein RGE_37120 [Rubrivivax gelatinosus IL144]|uniref:Uncharacterized protein n=1 Tax=Rubrivivax gelatinosus (strain NBRC 100245 / IL144) TaxID=983917 RepID=I0HVL4_RUBGI|nr:hypothetical protein RGE_37120 [Rubrivivax gelatinosus IL144]